MFGAAAEAEAEEALVPAAGPTFTRAAPRPSAVPTTITAPAVTAVGATVCRQVVGAGASGAANAF